MACNFCPIVETHNGETNAIIQKAIANRPPVSDTFRTTPFCSLQTGGGGQTELNIVDIEATYKKDYPEWNKSCQSFPPGNPLYYDKLAKTKPWFRAADLEDRLEEVERKKVKPISQIPNHENQEMLLEDSAAIVMESLLPVSTVLDVKPNKVKQVKKIIKGQARKSLDELKNPATSHEALNKLQEKALDEIKTKSRDWQNLSER